jgi:hypothetical protein
MGSHTGDGDELVPNVHLAAQEVHVLRPQSECFSLAQAGTDGGDDQGLEVCWCGLHQPADLLDREWHHAGRRNRRSSDLAARTDRDELVLHGSVEHGLDEPEVVLHGLRRELSTRGGDQGLDVGSAHGCQRPVPDAREDVQAQRALVQPGCAGPVGLRLQPGPREVGEQHPAGAGRHVRAPQEVAADLVQPTFRVRPASEVASVLLVGRIAVPSAPPTVRPLLH